MGAGCECGMWTMPVQGKMVWVLSAKLAKNIRHEVTFSARSVMCSPTNASQKPSFSANSIAARSSARVCHGCRDGGCTGIMNVPSFIVRSRHRLDVAAGGRFENRLERRDVPDHLILRHRIGLAAGGGVGERLEIVAHRERGAVVDGLDLAGLEALEQDPALGVLRVALVAYLDPALAAVDPEPAIEGRRQYRADQRVGAALEVDQDRQGVAVGEVA